MYTIVGLGNPGKEYESTRHNTGRALVALFASANGFSEWRFDKKSNAEVAAGNMKEKKTVLVLPETFMNKSGSAVLRYVKSVKAAKGLIVVHDDIDLPFGTVRVSFGRGDGGHRGVASVARAVKTREFVRVRVGISPPGARGAAKKPIGEKKVLAFILGAFTPSEKKELLKKISARVSEILETTLSFGYEVAMNRYNGRP